MTAAGFYDRIRGQLSYERLFFLIFLVALFLRFYQLDLKLFHHDEAIHAWFSYRLLTEGVYTYDPMYHGPLLYYTTAGMFSFLGDADLVGRIIPSLLGLLLIPLLYPIYRLGYLDTKQTLIAALFIAVSPDMVYFSRFLRNDIFIVFFTMVLLVALLYYFERRETKYALIAGAAVGLGMSSKENMPIVVVIFGSYLLYLIATRRLELPGKWKTDLLLGGLVTVGIMAALYSSFGAHPDVLADGWLRAIEHWTAMHQQERLGGPPFMYIILFLLYEVPIFILAVFGTVQFLGGDGRAARLVQSLRRRLGRPERPELQSLDAVAGTRIIDRQDEFMRFSVYWLVLSLAAYAYIGEKVPWLILHQLLPLIFVAVYRMTTRKAIVAVALSVFLITMTWHVAFTPADINEPIVQVQNSEDLRTVMALIDASDRVAIASENYWPLPWYYRGNASQKLQYYGGKIDEGSIYSQNFDMVITYDQDTYPALTGYEKTPYKINYWFSYYDNQDRLAEYYVTRTGKLGSMNFEIFTKPGLAENAAG
ncbi:TIGR03663 family protein [Methanoculleus sp. FWC-SCC1]|uniref:TIGR03663 family protein n=1 Tax=Methanoculleus frigidifontis TaxID=2584085 RepID=A0ABT8MBS2_9EURY|nr:flippase activity-associated protein Agl23 [Methanoculleus sp. FWC-SCC1]MDN7025389.1 TIGR03663 family protein [Methanoculleus sp. FWC-SCC1]